MVEKNLALSVVAALALVWMVSPTPGGAADYSPVPELADSPTPTPLEWPEQLEGSRDAYTGMLRVYITEPNSRWADAHFNPYNFGFLSFAIVTPVNVPDGGTSYFTAEWDAEDVDMDPVSSDNIAATGVVFNSEGHLRYSDPDAGLNPFTAYFADAAALALPGIPGRNDTVGGFTHTVFIEECGSTW